MLQTAETGFDAAIMDRENQAVALVQVKANPEPRWDSVLPKQLTEAPDRIGFVLTIDPNSISLYRPEEQDLGEPVVRLDTRQVLQHYDPEFPRRRVFESYLQTLAEAWLRDLAYHWNSDKPPGSEELAGTGLLERIEGGTTQRLGA